MGTCSPPGGPEEQQRAWQDMWSTIELLRLLVARPERWEARFTQGLTGLLSYGERLALPGEAERAVFISADATLERHAAVDWTAGIAIQRDVREDGRWLVLASRLEDEEDPENLLAAAFDIGNRNKLHNRERGHVSVIMLICDIKKFVFSKFMK